MKNIYQPIYKSQADKSQVNKQQVNKQQQIKDIASKLFEQKTKRTKLIKQTNKNNKPTNKNGK